VSQLIGAAESATSEPVCHCDLATTGTDPLSSSSAAAAAASSVGAASSTATITSDQAAVSSPTNVAASDQRSRMLLRLPEHLCGTSLLLMGILFLVNQ